MLALIPLPLTQQLCQMRRGVCGVSAHLFTGYCLLAGPQGPKARRLVLGASSWERGSGPGSDGHLEGRCVSAAVGTHTGMGGFGKAEARAGGVRAAGALGGGEAAPAGSPLRSHRCTPTMTAALA